MKAWAVKEVGGKIIPSQISHGKTFAEQQAKDWNESWGGQLSPFDAQTLPLREVVPVEITELPTTTKGGD